MIVRRRSVRRRDRGCDGGEEEEAKPKKPSELTPAKMQAIEAELSSVMSGMMTSIVSNILTQEPSRTFGRASRWN